MRDLTRARSCSISKPIPQGSASASWPTHSSRHVCWMTRSSTSVLCAASIDAISSRTAITRYTPSTLPGTGRYLSFFRELLGLFAGRSYFVVSRGTTAALHFLVLRTASSRASHVASQQLERTEAAAGVPPEMAMPLHQAMSQKLEQAMSQTHAAQLSQAAGQPSCASLPMESAL
jgi:hypothetical protein